MSQSPQPNDAATKKQQLNKPVIVLVVVVAVVFFALGVISSHAVATGLETISHGLHSASMWITRGMILDHSGAALAKYEHGEDTDLFSSAEKSRLKKR